MKTSLLTCGVLFVSSLCACDHPAVPAEPPAPAASETPAQAVTAPEPTASDSANAAPAAPRGKRTPCTSDQSCNGDPSVSALWGHCVKDRGVCECNAGFELHPSGYCQKVAN